MRRCMPSVTRRLPCLAMHAIHGAHLGMPCRSPSARCQKQACARVRACVRAVYVRERCGVRERACLHACMPACLRACVRACLPACLRACQALPWCRACRMYKSRSIHYYKRPYLTSSDGANAFGLQIHGTIQAPPLQIFHPSHRVVFARLCRQCSGRIR